MDFSTRSREIGDQLLVEVRGTIDISTAPQLRAQLIDAISEGWFRLVLDLSDVEFIDSTGLGVLVGVLNRVRAAGGSLRVVATDDAVMRPLRVTGLHKVLNVCGSVDAAVVAAV